MQKGNGHLTFFLGSPQVVKPEQKFNHMEFLSFLDLSLVMTDFGLKC